MNPGLQTQPLLWDILIRPRVAPVCVVGDITKAFLQVELHILRIVMPFDFCIEMRMDLNLTTDFVICHLVVKAHLSYLVVYIIV